MSCDKIKIDGLLTRADLVNTATNTKLDLTAKKIVEYNAAEDEDKKKTYLEIKKAKEASDKEVKKLIDLIKLELQVCDTSFYSASSKVFTKTTDPKTLCSTGKGCNTEFCSDHYDDSSCFMNDIKSKLPWIIIPIILLIVIYVMMSMKGRGGPTITM